MKPMDNSLPAQIARNEIELSRVTALLDEACHASAIDPANEEKTRIVESLEAEIVTNKRNIERLRKASIVECGKVTKESQAAALALQKQRPPAYLKLTDETIAATEAAVEYIHGLGPLLARIQAVQQERQSIAAAGLRAGAGKDYVNRHASKAGLANCEPTIGAALAHALASAGVGRTRPSMDPYLTLSAPAKAPDVAAGLRNAADNIVTVLAEFIARDEQEVSNG